MEPLLLRSHSSSHCFLEGVNSSADSSGTVVAEAVVRTVVRAVTIVLGTVVLGENTSGDWKC